MRVAELEPSDFEAWRIAYAAYADAVDSPVDDATTACVWAWLMAREHDLLGIAAFEDDVLIGFAHLRPFPRTLDGNVAGFLDDLFVVKTHRGSTAVRALFERIASIAAARSWTHVRWVTSEGNERARRLYDKIARPIRVRTYRLDTSDRR